MPTTDPRVIEYTNQFKRDVKREQRGQQATALTTIFPQVVRSLSLDEPLDEKYRDHPLTGNWRDHRDCHIKPDLVLIYRKPDPHTLQLVRLGSHSELYKA